MQRSSGSAGQPAHHSEDSSAGKEKDGKGKTAGAATPLSGAISADSSSDKGGSAEQPVTSLRTAEQPLSSSAPHWHVDVFRSIEHLDAGGEIQPSKRCKYDGMMVPSKDFIVPEILQPIKAALAEEIDKFEIECEQWDPPNFGEDATQEDKPKFLMREVYKRLRSRRARECLPAYTAAQTRPIYAVIKGLLALLHSDVQTSVPVLSSSPVQKQIVANDLYADLCSHRMQDIDLSVSNVELLALAVRQQMINNNKDNSRHAIRYLKYLADFAELHALSELRAKLKWQVIDSLPASAVLW